MTITLYPHGYGTQMLLMSEIRARHEPIMHPEYARRLFAWLESEGGRIGIGSGYRSSATQLRLWLSNPRRFARPGNSFHEEHRWASGGSWYAAVDLVVARPGAVHRSPSWAEMESAKAFGIHAFITGEPWHAQLRETRSCSDWKKAGSPDPLVIALPGNPTPTPPPTGSSTIVNVTVTTIRKGDQGGWVRKLQALLTTFNQDVTVDGDFGPQTDTSVRAVQAFLGLTVDGVAGPQTWGVLLNIAPDA